MDIGDWSHDKYFDSPIKFLCRLSHNYGFHLSPPHLVHTEGFSSREMNLSLCPLGFSWFWVHGLKKDSKSKQWLVEISLAHKEMDGFFAAHCE